MWTTISIVLATLAMLLIGAGLFFASDRRRHIPLMLAAFVADMIGLVIVEFIVPNVDGGSDPVTGLMERDETWTIRIIHASFATLALVGYIIQMVTGRKLMKGDYSVRDLHRKTAKFFLVTRLAAYVTMFMV